MKQIHEGNETCFQASERLTHDNALYLMAQCLQECGNVRDIPSHDKQVHLPVLHER